MLKVINLKIGAPEFWEHHSENYNDDNNDDEDGFNINLSDLRKRGPTINVKKTY